MEVVPLAEHPHVIRHPGVLGKNEEEATTNPVLMKGINQNQERSTPSIIHIPHFSIPETFSFLSLPKAGMAGGTGNQFKRGIDRRAQVRRTPQSPH